MEKQRLVHILTSADSGGCERACDHLCRYGREVDHHIIVLGSVGEMSKIWNGSGATVEHLQQLGKGRFSLAKTLRERLQRLKPDAVIAWHGMAELPVILSSIPSPCKRVAVHGGNPASNLSIWTDLRYLAMEWLLFRRTCDPLYICCSQHVSDTFKRSRYLNRFQRCVVANGVFSVSEEMIHKPRLLPAKDGHVVLGMLARLDLIKDQATAIRGMAEIKKKFPEVVLELAGDGDQALSLQALALELGLSNNVKFLGMVQHVTEVIRTWDICLYATTANEGFGIALAECLMTGLPTVVTDIGPVREVCSAGGDDAVVYVKPFSPEEMAQAVSGLIIDLKARQGLSQKARCHALQNLSGQAFAQRYLQYLFSGAVAMDANN